MPLSFGIDPAVKYTEKLVMRENFRRKEQPFMFFESVIGYEQQT
jgi:hypothetical protein